MLVNICMKFHEDILNKLQSDFVLETATYKVQRDKDILNKLQSDFVLETATYKVQRDVTQKV